MYPYGTGQARLINLGYFGYKTITANKQDIQPKHLTNQIIVPRHMRYNQLIEPASSNTPDVQIIDTHGPEVCVCPHARACVCVGGGTHLDETTHQMQEKCEPNPPQKKNSQLHFLSTIHTKAPPATPFNLQSISHTPTQINPHFFFTFPTFICCPLHVFFSSIYPLR